jgi:hypothetical protein
MATVADGSGDRGGRGGQDGRRDRAVTCELYEATADGDGLPGVFVLGSLSHREPVTVSVQQARAINLVHALVPDRLPPGSRLCVIGGGAAGLTAAAYAIVLGLRVTVLEQRKPLWNLRGCRTRWLHPNLFQRWPDDGWDVTATDFPVMNWYADYACSVGELLWAKYRAYFRHQPDATGRDEVVLVRDVRLEPAAGGGWTACYCLQGDTHYRSAPFDAVIAAVGFGAEAAMRDAAASVYWLDDAIEREDPHRLDVRYLVSGTGDGGLTDLLRIRLREFRHHHLRELLLRLGAGRPQLADEVLAADAQVLADATDDRTHVSRRFLDIAARTPAGLILRDRRITTSALITNREGVALPRGAWRISRFLAAMLLEHDREHTRYVESGEAGVEVHALVPGQQRSPYRFEVMLGRGHARHKELVDAVVFRHGPEPVARRFLLDNGVTPIVLDRIDTKWRGRTTSTLSFAIDDRHDHRGRRRARAVRAPVAGRSLVGVLSRLVGCIDPATRIADPDCRLPAIRSTLVTDELAMLLTARGDRWQGDRPFDGWQLGSELDYDEVISAIRIADQAFDPAAARVHELEQHWVLPRPFWWPAPAQDVLLLNTCVARHWQGGHLRYAVADDASALAIAALANGLGALAGASSTLWIVDLPDVQRRVAVPSVATPHTRRLARELGSNYVSNSGSLEEIVDDG